MRVPSKQNLKAAKKTSSQIADDIAKFQANGGKIELIPQGASGVTTRMLKQVHVNEMQDL